MASIREPQSLSLTNHSTSKSNTVIIGLVALKASVTHRSRAAPSSRISLSSRHKRFPFHLILSRMRLFKKTISMSRHLKTTRNILEKRLMPNILGENSWPVALDKMASFLPYNRALKVVQTPKFRTSPYILGTLN
jgi:hypothetical protein